MKKISVIAPVYNEEKVIPLFCDAIKDATKDISNYYFEIILCVDRCSDKTLDVIKDLAKNDKNIKALYMSGRFGHQAALLAGLDHSDADAVIMMDADMQHPPKLIPALVKKYEEGYDIVYTEKVDNKAMPLFSRFSSYCFYKVVNILSELKIHPQAADFRIIDRKVVDVFKNNLRESNIFIRGLISWVGFEQTYIPFTVDQRGGGRSKFNFKRLMSFAMAGILSFSLKPLRIATYLGLATTFFAVLFVLYTFYAYFFAGVGLKGWTSIVILICFFSGIQLMVLGILGEYIGAIFLQGKSRPSYIIDEKVNF